MAKGTGKKKSKKRVKTPISVKSKVVADIVGCNDSTVRQVRSGALKSDTELTTNIMAVDTFLGKGLNQLVEAARNLVPIN